MGNRVQLNRPQRQKYPKKITGHTFSYAKLNQTWVCFFIFLGRFLLLFFAFYIYFSLANFKVYQETGLSTKRKMIFDEGGGILLKSDLKKVSWPVFVLYLITTTSSMDFLGKWPHAA